MVELDFWAKKEANLRSISEQIHSGRVDKVARVRS